MCGSNEDNVYFNIRIKGTDPNLGQGTRGNRAKFEVSTIEPVLKDASKYELAVIRFSVPTEAVPIFIWKGNDVYNVRMTYGASEVYKNLIFVQNSTSDLYGGSIWNYQEFVDIINNALSDAFTDLKALEPLMPPTEAPFMTYDPSTGLLSYNVEQVYANTTQVFLNEPLYLLVPSFQNFDVKLAPTVYYFQLLAKDNKNNSIIYNGKNYYSTKQEWRTLFLWSDFQTILFETNLIPVNPEYLPSQNNATRQLLTDFEPLEDINNRSAIQFYPRGDLRWYSLTSNDELNNLDLNVLWEDQGGNLYPLYLPDNATLTMKLQFRKIY
jgi:hypothetical protein